MTSWQVIVEDSGHYVPLEQPDELHRAIDQRLSAGFRSSRSIRRSH